MKIWRVSATLQINENYVSQRDADHRIDQLRALDPKVSAFYVPIEVLESLDDAAQLNSNQAEAVGKRK